MVELMTSAEDREALVQRAQAGDPQAFDDLIELHRRRLAAHVRSRLGAPLQARVEVDDVLQEISLRAMKSIQAIHCEDENAFFRWLGTIAERVIVDLAP